MSEDPNRTTPDRDTPDLKEELREMGQQLEHAFRTVVESERTKQLQRDLAAGVREITAQLRAAVENLQKDPRVKEAETRGRETLEDLRETKVAQDIQEAVVTGIATLNVQLRRLVERIEQESKAAASSTPSQHVPIEQEPPATGETKRLDE
jgi:ribosome-associated translation inhibitor RaiA